MDKYLKMEIKPLIRSFPEVGKILEKYGIGCVPCSVGTCRLEDVVKIHALAPDLLAEMMYFVEKALYPDREIPKPAFTPPVDPAVPQTIRYSPPLKRLVDEHAWIKRLLALVPEMVLEMRRAGSIDRGLVLGAVDFIRGYADRFHHMKEEDILFEYTDRDAAVIQVIYQDHDRGRGFIREVVAGVESGDLSSVCFNLENYRTLLTEHIGKEDEVLYPFIDRGLSTRQIGEMHARFNEVDGKAEKDIPKRFLDFVMATEKRYGKK